MWFQDCQELLPVDCAIRRDCYCSNEYKCVVKEKTTTTTSGPTTTQFYCDNRKDCENYNPNCLAEGIVCKCTKGECVEEEVTTTPAVDTTTTTKPEVCETARDCQQMLAVDCAVRRDCICRRVADSRENRHIY